MPLFSDPDYRPGPRDRLSTIATSAGLLLGFLGWAMVAISLSQLGPYFAIAGFGLIAAVLSRRAFALSLIFELLALGAAGAVISAFVAIPEETAEWFYVGAAIIVIARGATLAVIRKARRDDPPVGKKLDV